MSSSSGCCPGWRRARRSPVSGSTAELEVRDASVSGLVEAVVGGGLAGGLRAGRRGRRGDRRRELRPACRPRPRRTSTRRAARCSLTLDAAPARCSPGAGRLLLDVSRLVFAAEAVGMAQACVELASEYARTRTQFGRVIAMFQAVKHHCANMAVAAELATAADVGRRTRVGRRRRRVHATPPRRRCPRASRRRPERQPEHPGARRHRHHLGARRAPLRAPGDRARVAAAIGGRVG